MAERLKLVKPIARLSISQAFGEDKTCIDRDTRDRIARNVKTCPAGFVSLYQSSGMQGHNGIDILAHRGEPIYAATAGVVTAVEEEPARGIGIEIISFRKYRFDFSPFSSSGAYFAKTRYWHLLSSSVREGDEVEAGQQIGFADNTGYSSGDHLHFELKPVASRGVFRRTLRNAFHENGFFGAVDPLPYLS